MWPGIRNGLGHEPGPETETRSLTGPGQKPYLGPGFLPGNGPWNGPEANIGPGLPMRLDQALFLAGTGPTHGPNMGPIRGNGPGLGMDLGHT